MSNYTAIERLFFHIEAHDDDDLPQVEWEKLITGAIDIWNEQEGTDYTFKEVIDRYFNWKGI